MYVTDWQTAATELGVSTAHYVEAQWLLQVQSGLQSDGIVSTAPTPEEFCANADTHTKGPGAGMYTSPFGTTSSSHAAWFAVTEIEMFGPYPSTPEEKSNLASRRLLQEQQQPLQDSLDDTMRRDLEQRRALRASQGPPEARHTVQALMESRGLYRYKSDNIYDDVRRNPAESVIYEHQTRAAPENGQHQPFANNLANMPNPQNEPVFYCSEYNIVNVSRMKCWEKKMPTLTHHSAPINTTNEMNASVSNNWATTLFSNEPELQQQLTKLNTAMQQRNLLRNLKFMQSMNAVQTQQQSQVVNIQHSSSSRRLLIIPWGAIGDMITDMATSIGKALIKALQIAVTSAMACSAYCTPARKCNNHQDIGQCLKGFVVFIAQKIFHILHQLPHYREAYTAD